MRGFVLLVTLACAPLIACPNAEAAAAAYALENFGGDEENPVTVQKQFTRINAQVTAVKFTLPAEAEGESQRISTAFFTGKSCDFADQWSGEIAEQLEFSDTKFLFIRHDEGDEDSRLLHYQVITVRSTGEVAATHDQHGSELQFSQALQPRCEGKVGEITTWQRDKFDSQLIIVRERQSDRDDKCRLIQDASSFRYYRLTAENWRLDDGDSEAASTTPAKRSP